MVVARNFMRVTLELNNGRNDVISQGKLTCVMENFVLRGTCASAPLLATAMLTAIDH